VNAFLPSTLTSQQTDDLEEILAGLHGVKQEPGELALAFFARITENAKLFPGLYKDSLISKRMLQGLRPEISANISGPEMESYLTLPRAKLESALRQ
jgi:hypothetical protein